MMFSEQRLAVDSSEKLFCSATEVGSMTLAEQLFFRSTGRSALGPGGFYHYEYHCYDSQCYCPDNKLPYYTGYGTFGTGIYAEDTSGHT